MISSAVVALIAWGSGLKGKDIIELATVIFSGALVSLAAIIWQLDRFKRLWDRFKIRGQKMITPINVLVLGVLCLGIGIIWFNYQQAKAMKNISQALSSLKETISPLSENVKQLNELAKKQVRLHILERDLLKFIELKDHYEKTLTRTYTIYLENKDGAALDHDLLMLNNRFLASFIDQLRNLIKKDFNEDINLFSVDPRYDFAKRFSEEGQIKDIAKKDDYRKAKHNYLIGKGKIDNLLIRYKQEIFANDMIIRDFGKGNIISPR